MKLSVTIELWRAAGCTEIECFRTVSDKSVISKITRYMPYRWEAKFLERPLKIPAFPLVRQSRRVIQPLGVGLDAQLWQPRTKWCAMIKGLGRFEKSTLKAQRWNEAPLKRIEVLLAHLNAHLKISAYFQTRKKEGNTGIHRINEKTCKCASFTVIM